MIGISPVVFSFSGFHANVCVPGFHLLFLVAYFVSVSQLLILFLFLICGERNVYLSFVLTTELVYTMVVSENVMFIALVLLH